ncbi:MAG: hypothetical protein WDO73_34250 [Ignavibacteriota bacterium]
MVVSAHLDGYGIGEPRNGDKIYNERSTMLRMWLRSSIWRRSSMNRGPSFGDPCCFWW